MVIVLEPHLFHFFSLPRVLDQSEYSTTEDEGSARPRLCVRVPTTWSCPFAILATFLHPCWRPREGGHLPLYSFPKYSSEPRNETHPLGIEKGAQAIALDLGPSFLPSACLILSFCNSEKLIYFNFRLFCRTSPNMNRELHYSYITIQGCTKITFSSC